MINHSNNVSLGNAFWYMLEKCALQSEHKCCHKIEALFIDKGGSFCSTNLDNIIRGIGGWEGRRFYYLQHKYFEIIQDDTR